MFCALNAFKRFNLDFHRFGKSYSKITQIHLKYILKVITPMKICYDDNA